MHSQGRFWFGTLLILVGGLLLLDTLRIVDFRSLLFDFWPLLLIVLGLYVIFRVRPSVSNAAPPGDQQVFGDVRTESPAESVHHSTVFGDLSIRVTSPSFRGGTISTVFGDTVLDLSGAVLAEGEQVLAINGVFGDCSVRIPKGTPYSIVAHALFGSLKTPEQHREGVSSTLAYDSPGFTSAAKRLKINVSQVFGDIMVEA